MKNIFKIILTVFFFIFSFVSFVPVNAQLIDSKGTKDIKNNMIKSGKGATYNTTGDERNFLISEVASTVVTAVLSLLGIIFIIMILIAGFNWMTAAGSEDKVSKSKSTLTQGVIGLTITVAAYLITAFVFTALSKTVGI